MVVICSKFLSSIFVSTDEFLQDYLLPVLDSVLCLVGR